METKLKTQVGLKAENVQLLPYACFIWWFYQYADKDELFCFELELLSVQLHSLPQRNRKGLARDLSDNFATNVGLLCDVTDTDCWAHRGSTCGCVFAAFEC